MSAPERIWIEDERPHGGICFVHTEGTAGQRLYGVEYIRADLARPTIADALALPEVAALVEAAHPIAFWTIGNMLADDPKAAEEHPHLSRAILKLRAALAALTTPPADGGKP